MKIPMPQKLIPYAIAILGILTAYYLYRTAGAIASGTIAADKRYHQALIFRNEDPLAYYQTLAFLVIGTLAPACGAFVLIRQLRSKTN